MTKKLNHCAPQFSILLFSLLLVVTLAVKVEAQQTGTPISRLRVIEYGGDLRALLGSLATSFEVVIGFEVARSEPNSYVTVSLREATNEDIMNAIVLNKPMYKWRKSSTGFEVLPVDQSDQFLQTVVSSFHVANASIDDALKTLIGTEEVVNALRASGIRASETAAPQNNQTRMNIDLQGVTIREALNRITLNSGAKFWTYQRDTAGPASLTIKIIGN